MLILKKPHPFIYNYKSVVIPGLVTFLVISIFAPFGFQDLAISNRLLIGSIISILCSLSIVLVVLGAKKMMPKLMLEDDWTIGKEILLILSVVITICLIIFSCFIFLDLSSANPLTIFRLVVLYTTLMSIIPITILVLYEQYSFQKQRASEANQLNKNLKGDHTAHTKNSSAIGHILFEAENGKVALQLAHDKVLYLKADGNYVEVFYIDQQNNVQKKLIRNRLKGLLETLPSQQFFHAHKSYVVNGRQIERVEGNARNFELVMYATVDRLPVSRSKSKELSIFLKSM